MYRSNMMTSRRGRKPLARRRRRPLSRDNHHLAPNHRKFFSFPKVLLLTCVTVAFLVYFSRSRRTPRSKDGNQPPSNQRADKWKAYVNAHELEELPPLNGVNDTATERAMWKRAAGWDSVAEGDLEDWAPLGPDPEGCLPRAPSFVAPAVVVGWGFGSTKLTLYAYRALESLLHVYPAARVKFLTIGPRYAFYYKWANIIAATQFQKYRKRGYDVKVEIYFGRAVATVRQGGKPIPGFRWWDRHKDDLLYGKGLPMDVFQSTQDALPDASTMLFLAFAELYKNGGIFVDLTTFFVRPLPPGVDGFVAGGEYATTAMDRDACSLPTASDRVQVPFVMQYSNPKHPVVGCVLSAYDQDTSPLNECLAGRRRKGNGGMDCVLATLEGCTEQAKMTNYLREADVVEWSSCSKQRTRAYSEPASDLSRGAAGLLEALTGLAPRSTPPPASGASRPLGADQREASSALLATGATGDGSGGGDGGVDLAAARVTSADDVGDSESESEGDSPEEGGSVVPDTTGSRISKSSGAGEDVMAEVGDAGDDDAAAAAAAAVMAAAANTAGVGMGDGSDRGGQGGVPSGLGQASLKDRAEDARTATDDASMSPDATGEGVNREGGSDARGETGDVVGSRASATTDTDDEAEAGASKPDGVPQRQRASRDTLTDAGAAGVHDGRVTTAEGSGRREDTGDDGGRGGRAGGARDAEPIAASATTTASDSESDAALERVAPRDAPLARQRRRLRAIDEIEYEDERQDGGGSWWQGIIHWLTERDAGGAAGGQEWWRGFGTPGRRLSAGAGDVPEQPGAGSEDGVSLVWMGPAVANGVWEAPAAGSLWEEAFSRLRLTRWQPQQVTASCRRPCGHWHTEGVQSELAKAQAGFQCAPSVFVPGTQKGASTFLFHAISHHPQVVQPLRGAHGFKETGRYAPHVAMGPDRLGLRLAAFPFIEEHENIVTGDGTVTYMLHNRRTPEAIRADNPDAKIVFALRDPVARAWSDFRFLWGSYKKLKMGFPDVAKASVAKMSACFDGHHAEDGTKLEFAGGGPEQLEISEEDAEGIRVLYSSCAAMREPGQILRKGMYYYQVVQWVQVFGRDNVMVVDSADLQSKQTETIEEVYSFLGLCPADLSKLEPENVTSNPDIPDDKKIDEDTFKMLQEFYKPYNKKLYKLLGRDLGWERNKFKPPR